MKAFIAYWSTLESKSVASPSKPLATLLLLAIVSFAPPVRAQIQREWVAFYHNSTETTNRPVAISMDEEGDIFVGGFSQGTNRPGSAFTALKYSAAGQEIWVARHLDPNGADDKPTSMKTDSLGNVYLTGQSKKSGSNSDFLTIKFDANGNEAWACGYNGPGKGDDQAKALAVDSQGNVYVTGKSYMASTNWPTGTVNDYAYTTIKYDAAGNALWVRRYANGHTDENPNGSSNQDAQSLALDADGNVYVAGISVFAPDPRSPGAGFAVVKYSPAGDQLAVWRYDNFGSTDGSSARVSVAIGPTGEVYVAGTMLPAFSPPPSYTVLKYATNGTREWVRTYYGPNPYGGNNSFQSLAVDAAANVLVSGTSPGTNNAFDCATVKFDGLGNQLWSDRYNPTTNGTTSASDLKLDAQGNAFVASSCHYMDQTWKFSVLKYSPSGQRLWGALYNSGIAGENVARGVTMDERGRSAVTGYVPAQPGGGQLFATVNYSAPPGAIALQSNLNYKVFFPGVPGFACRIQGSTNLVDWTDLGVVIADEDGAAFLEDPDSSQTPARFYRSTPP